MCVDLPDCIRKQSSRLRSPIPSPTLMKIRFAWPHPIAQPDENTLRLALWPQPLPHCAGGRDE